MKLQIVVDGAVVATEDLPSDLATENRDATNEAMRTGLRAALKAGALSPSQALRSKLRIISPATSANAWVG
jgi:hypothetical protein